MGLTTSNWALFFPPPADAGIHPTLFLFGFRADVLNSHFSFQKDEGIRAPLRAFGLQWSKDLRPPSWSLPGPPRACKGLGLNFSIFQATSRKGPASAQKVSQPKNESKKRKMLLPQDLECSSRSKSLFRLASRHLRKGWVRPKQAWVGIQGLGFRFK